MITYIKGNLFDSSYTEDILIPHVVNNQNSYGSGFVIPLTKKWPSTKNLYHKWATKPKVGQPDFKLGQILPIIVEDNITVIHMLAQELGGKRPLYYNHLVHCMEKVGHYAVHEGIGKIVCPKFASGLAGGKWEFVECLIEDIWANLDVNVFYLE